MRKLAATIDSTSYIEPILQIQLNISWDRNDVTMDTQYGNLTYAKKKCQWSSLLCIAISFPLNVFCFQVSIVLSFFDPRKKEFFNSNKNCGFHDRILIAPTFSSIPLHHYSYAKFLTSCLCFFISSTKIKLQCSATTHFEDDFKHLNPTEKHVAYAYNE